MPKFNTIIIGGGLGGLTAGAALSKFGKKVLLLEQHYLPGGCATAFKRKEFVFEVGLHGMDGLDQADVKVSIFNLLDVFSYVEFLKTPEFFHLSGTKEQFTFPHGMDESLNELLKKFPNEEKGLQKFFNLTKGVLKEIPNAPRTRLRSFLLYPLMPILYPNLVKASGTTVGKWLDNNINNEQLKLILAANILYYSDDPYDLSMMFFSLAQASYITGGSHFIKGGSQKLSDYLAKYINDNGGQVLLGKHVEKIIIENGKAVGVKYCDAYNAKLSSKIIYADSIICNAAIPNIPAMLPTKEANYFKEKINKLQPACSLLSIYIGFDIDLKKFGVKHYSTFFPSNKIKCLADLKTNFQGDWENKSFAFVDYSQLNSALTQDGKSVGVICAADYLSEWEDLDNTAYQLKKEKVAQSFFKRLEQNYPGITNHIEYYEVSTAKTIKRYTLNPQGTPYGFAQKLSQSGMARMAIQSPVKNMYFASAWAFPGGGFSGAIISGFLTALKLYKSHKFGNYDTKKINDERKVKLLSKKIIAENTIEITIEKPENFCFTPGQYIILKINHPKYSELDLPFRSLSIVSHPEEDNLRLAMRGSNSSFKRSIAEMSANQFYMIYGPVGSFTVEEKIRNTIVFYVSGIGITPIIPMLKELQRKKYPGKVLLFYSNKSDKTIAYHDEIQAIALSNFTYIPVFTNLACRINEQLIKKHLSDWESCNHYIVGTTAFTKSIQEILLSNNVQKEKITTDDFG